MLLEHSKIGLRYRLNSHPEEIYKLQKVYPTEFGWRSCIAVGWGEHGWDVLSTLGRYYSQVGEQC